MEDNKQPDNFPGYKILKMVSGEVIISAVGVDKRNYVLRRPMTITTMEIYGKNMKVKKSAVGLRQWMEYSSNECYYIPRNSILTIGDPDDDILEMYEQAKQAEDDSLLDEQSIDEIKKEFGHTGNTDQRDDLDDEFQWKNKPRNFPKK